MLSLRPGDGRVLANLGLSYGALRQHQQSIEALEAAWRSYPHPRVRWMLADSGQRRRSPGEGLFTPGPVPSTNPSIGLRDAKHLLIGGHPEEAGAALEEAERRSNRAEVRLLDRPRARQGRFPQVRQGRYKDAEIALRAGLDRGGSPGIERVDLAMASLLVDMGGGGTRLPICERSRSNWLAIESCTACWLPARVTS